MSGKAQTRSDGHDSSLSSFFVRNLFSPAALPLFSQQLSSFHLACHTLGRCQSSFATGACRRKEKGGNRGAERRSVSVRERKKSLNVGSEANNFRPGRGGKIDSHAIPDCLLKCVQCLPYLFLGCGGFFLF